MRGANFIPIDSFPSRIALTDLQYIMKISAEANMNMIRVWGGGVYQPDAFYDIADEMGILIWQEVMLACSMYPADTEFLAEVKQVSFVLKRHAFCHVALYLTLLLRNYTENPMLLIDWSATSLQEVEHQVLRLNSHPSIVVWGGNNENEVALRWFAVSVDNRDLYVSDYSTLYGQTVFPAVVRMVSSVDAYYTS